MTTVNPVVNQAEQAAAPEVDQMTAIALMLRDMAAGQAAITARLNAMDEAIATPAPKTASPAPAKTSSPAVSSNTPKATVNAPANAKPKSAADIMAELEALRAENERLRSSRTTLQKLSVKISEKGALSVYGLGRFPTTLYAQQWEFLLNPVNVKFILDFIKTHPELERKS